jgi:transposase
LAAAMTVVAATSTAVFRAFVEQVLAPALRDRPGTLVVMDNLAPHKAAVVHEAIRAAGLEPRLLPRHSPDLNPIEQCWSKIKTLLRAREARSLDELDRELPAVLAAVTAEDARGWFQRRGYAPDRRAIRSSGARAKVAPCSANDGDQAGSNRGRR